MGGFFTQYHCLFLFSFFFFFLIIPHIYGLVMDNLKKTLVILIWKSGLKGAQNFIHVYKMYLEIIYFFSSYFDVVFSLECECVVLLVECQYIFSISYRFRDKLNRNGQKGANFQNLNTFFFILY